MYRINDNALVFVHIHKTAGTTLRTIIERFYGEGEIYKIYPDNPKYPDMDVFKALPADEKARYKVFCGHISFGLHEMVPRPCTYITVLRDPVERVVSFFAHVTRDKGGGFENREIEALHGEVESRRMRLREFVSSGLTVYTDNLQTRVLSDMDPPFGECTPEMLEVAKKNVRDRFAVAGLTERFDESVVLMRRMLGWRTPFYVRTNVSRNKPKEIDGKTAEEIGRRNELDLELYAWAEKLLDEKIAEQGESFQRELKEFRRLNGRFSAHHNRRDDPEGDEMARRLAEEVENIKGSLSWKVTAPLRGVLRVLGR